MNPLILLLFLSIPARAAIPDIVTDPATKEVLEYLDSKINISSAPMVEAFGTNITSAAVSGQDLLFNPAGAPVLYLTVGTWLVFGSCQMSTNPQDNVALGFKNTTDNVLFGQSGGNYRTATVPDLYTTFAPITIDSGTKAIYLYGYRNGASVLTMGTAGAANVPIATLRAVRIF